MRAGISKKFKPLMPSCAFGEGIDFEGGGLAVIEWASNIADINNEEHMSSDIEVWGSMEPLADLGPTDRQKEGTYRRGYHQAIAEVMVLLENGKQLTPEILTEWVEGDGMKWRYDTPLDRHILAPALIKPIS